jgi:hypothetical protein
MSGILNLQHRLTDRRISCIFPSRRSFSVSLAVNLEATLRKAGCLAQTSPLNDLLDDEAVELACIGTNDHNSNLATALEQELILPPPNLETSGRGVDNSTGFPMTNHSLEQRRFRAPRSFLGYVQKSLRFVDYRSGQSTYLSK